MFLVKCGQSFLVATIRKNTSVMEKTKSVIENLSIFMCVFRGGKQSRPLQNIASFKEVCRYSDQWAHIYSAPHARANDEKNNNVVRNKVSSQCQHTHEHTHTQ